jgi:acid phosphatase
MQEFAVVTEWFGGCESYQIIGTFAGPDNVHIDKSHEYRRLAMGPLLNDLQTKMQKKVNEGEQNPTKLMVYSTHDTALAGIAAALDVFDQRCVPCRVVIPLKSSPLTNILTS